MNYFEKHIGDYIRDTVSLTMLEDGAYNRLMDQMYQSERPLPSDKKMVYRLARANSSAERKAVDFVLDTFFNLTEQGFEQKRIRAEIERYQEKQRKAKASADARWNKPKPDANASQTHDASDMRTHSGGNAHQSPDTRHQTKDLGSGGDFQPELDADNDRFPARPQHNAPTANMRAVSIATLLTGAGVKRVTAFHPDVAVTWAQDERVTDELLLAAVSKAKESLGNEPFQAPYLRPIVVELLSPPATKAPKASDAWAWRKTPQGIEAKGRELGMFARGSENHDAFANRIQIEIDKRKGQAA